MSVSCQHGLVRRAGESISYMQQRRHRMTVRGLKLYTAVQLRQLLSTFSGYPVIVNCCLRKQLLGSLFLYVP